MIKDFWDKIDKLEEAAQRATTESWMTGEFKYEPCWIVSPVTGFCLAQCRVSQNGVNNAAFIARANPLMIMGMIAELKRLEKEADWLAEKYACQNIRNGCQCGIDKNYRREAARKAIAEADNA